MRIALAFALATGAMVGCASKVVEGTPADGAIDTPQDCENGTPDGRAPCLRNADCPADMYCQSCGCPSYCVTRTPEKCLIIDVCSCDGKTRFTDLCTPANAGIATRTCPD